MGYLIGELAFVAAAIAYLVESGGGGLDRGKAWSRRVLLVVHLALVLVGLEAAVLISDIQPEWLAVVTRVGNILSLCLVPVVVVRGYPMGTLAMVNETFVPLLLGVAWSFASSQFNSAAAQTWKEALVEPVVFLGLHHLAVVGPLFVSLLLNPPRHAEAASLPLAKRLTSGFGIFWMVLMALWTTQAVYALVVLGSYAFDQSTVLGALAVVLFLVSVGNSVRQLKVKVVYGP